MLGSVWDAYQGEAMTTAIYPQQGANLPYAVLGLCEETAEALEKLNAGASAIDLQLELGDIAWYLVACCSELNLSMLEVSSSVATSPCEAAALPTLVIKHGKVAGLVKKSMRDDAGHLTSNRKASIKVLLGQSMQIIEAISEAHGWSIESVLAANLQKLKSRSDRYTLHGSGDRR